MQFTISGREKVFNLDESISSYLKRVYTHVPLAQVESIFAFTERSTLYGGRPFHRPQLLAKDIEQMYQLGIGYRIPLTNNFVTREEYETNVCFLEKYHRKGNSVILVNDDLAGWIRKDFPKYRIEASIIKSIDNTRRLDKALEIYDTVVLPTSLNENLEFLDNIECKQRITLFAFAGCGINCPSKICYPSMSKFNKYNGHTQIDCSQPTKARESRGRVKFDLSRYTQMGFNRFKMIEPLGAVRRKPAVAKRIS
ncbi:hypothetical protein [Thalassotalea sp. PLHSN55]|uniref:hypothetical protein n=1 Tax=Thalassotalea sp. PLHSN55 TaxID=3435888 RepID=UPI003F848876